MSLIKGIPNEEYHRSSGFSRSTAWNVITGSPARVDYDRNHPTKPTSALILGNGFHSATLEPHLFEKEFEVKPGQIDGKSPLTKHYKEKFASMQEKDESITWLSRSDFEMVSDMADSANSNPWFRSMMDSGKFIVEGTGYFDCEGVKCKVRPDLYDPESGLIIDLKSTQDASEQGFRSSVRKFGYHFQTFWYMEGLRRLGHHVSDFVFVAVEKAPPYLVGIYRINPEEVARQERQMIRACQIWANCTATETFPGYSTEVVTLY